MNSKSSVYKPTEVSNLRQRRSSKTFEDLIGAIFSFLIFGGLSIGIGESLCKRYKLFPPESLLSAILGAAVLATCIAGIVGLIILGLRVSEWRKSWGRCAHGIAGGKARRRCKKCVSEQQAADAAYRLRQELEEAQRRIAAVANKLHEEERRRLAGSIVPSLAELRRLTWQQFEDEIARMFERFGYTVEQTPYVNDHGRDAILTKGGHKFLLECKKYADGRFSGRPELQKFHSAIMTDGASHGHFVTTGSFTKDAVDFAATVPIDLIDGGKLVRYMFESKRVLSDNDKYRSMCLKCGDVVQHRLRTPETIICKNGHRVEPTLDFVRVLEASDATPTCKRCGAPMRLVHWRRRKKFWGCTKYPQCRFRRNWSRPPV